MTQTSDLRRQVIEVHNGLTANQVCPANYSLCLREAEEEEDDEEYTDEEGSDEEDLESEEESEEEDDLPGPRLAKGNEEVGPNEFKVDEIIAEGWPEGEGVPTKVQCGS